MSDHVSRGSGSELINVPYTQSSAGTARVGLPSLLLPAVLLLLLLLRDPALPCLVLLQPGEAMTRLPTAAVEPPAAAAARSAATTTCVSSPSRHPMTDVLYNTLVLLLGILLSSLLWAACRGRAGDGIHRPSAAALQPLLHPRRRYPLPLLPADRRPRPRPRPTVQLLVLMVSHRIRPGRDHGHSRPHRHSDLRQQQHARQRQYHRRRGAHWRAEARLFQRSAYHH